MRDLSMHILDIVQNSTRAGASLVEINVIEDVATDNLSIEFIDNGCGMDDETMQKVTNPFFTSRTTRKVGLGIPLLMQNAEATGGSIDIKSTVGVGTTLIAHLSHTHIDRPPWGDMAGTIALIISGHPEVDFCYRHTFNGEMFEMDSRVIKNELDGLSINHPQVIKFMKEMIFENLNELGVEMN